MFIKKLEKNVNISNNIFCHFEFVICFSPLLHEVEKNQRNIILDLSSTADSVKSKRENGDTPTRHVSLCEDPHGSVVGAVCVHILRTMRDTSPDAAIRVTSDRPAVGTQERYFSTTWWKHTEYRRFECPHGRLLLRASTQQTQIKVGLTRT